MRNRLAARARQVVMRLLAEPPAAGWTGAAVAAAAGAALLAWYVSQNSAHVRVDLIFGAAPGQFVEAWAGWGPFAGACGRHAVAVAAAAAVLLAGVGWGAALRRWLAPRAWRGTGRLALAASLGLGAVALAVLGAALAGLLRPAVLASLAGAGAALAVSPLRGARPRPGSLRAAAGGPLGAILLVLAAACLAIDLAACLGPAWFYDSRAANLALPERWLMEGRMAHLQGNLTWLYPQNVQVLYAVAFAGGGEEACRVLNWSLGALVAASARAVATRWAGPLAGALAAAAWITAPVAMIEQTIAFTENGWTLWTLWGLAAWSERCAGRRGGRAVLAGTLLGLGCGAKYLGALPLAGAAAALAILRPAGGACAGAAALAAAASVALPWGLRNAGWTGNPVYPFLGGWFGRPGLTDAEWTAWLASNPAPPPGPAGLPGWVTLPWVVAMGAPRGALFGFPAGPLWLALAPFVAWGWPRGDGRALALAVAAAAGFAGWAATATGVRYLVPVLAAAAVLWGAGAARAPRAAAWLAAAWAALAPPARVSQGLNVAHYEGALAHALGRLTPADAAAARGAPPEAAAVPGRVLVIGTDEVLGLGRPWVASYARQALWLARWAAVAPDETRLGVALRQAGVRSVLIRRERYEGSAAFAERWAAIPPEVLARMTAFLEHRTSRVLAGPGYEWRRVVAAGPRRGDTGPRIP